MKKGTHGFHSCGRWYAMPEPTKPYVGVSFANERGSWLSRIFVNGKLKNLGYFKNELDASNAYKEALKNI